MRISFVPSGPAEAPRAHRLGLAPVRGGDARRRLAHAVHADARVPGAEEPRRERVVRGRALAEPQAPPREVGVLDERAGLVPARHDRASLRLEERQRRPRLDDLLEDDPAAAGHGGEGAQDETAAPEERQMAPPRVLGRHPEAGAHAARRGDERTVAVHHGLGARRRARGEEDGGEIGRRDARLERVERSVVRRGRKIGPALRARRLAFEQHDATERRRRRRAEAARRGAGQLGHDLAEDRQVVELPEPRQHDQHLDVAVRERIGELVALPEGRERDQDRAQAERPEGDRQPLEPIRAEEADPRPLADARRDELPRRLPAAAAELVPREPRRDAVARRVRHDLPAAVRGGERVEKAAERLHRRKRE